MKKLATIFMALIFALFMLSCGSDDESTDGDSAVDTGDSAADTGDSAADTGDSAGDSGSTGGDSGSTGGDSGSTGGDSGSTGGDSGSTGGDSGSTGGDSGSTGGDSGSTGGDTGDSAADADGTDTGSDADETDTGSDSDETDTGNDADETDTGSDADGTDTGSDADETDTGSDADETDTGSDADETETSECTGISVGDFELVKSNAYLASVTEGLDSAVQDFVQIAFFPSDENPTLKVKTYDLSTEINSDYATCEQCVLAFEDVTEESIGKTYFQQEGTLEITEIKEGTFETKGFLSSVKLVEATIDDSSFHSTPVPGGSCLEIETGGWDTICVPNCEGKICGPDGCGGFCGECEDGETRCNAEQNACVPYECVEVALGEDFQIDPDEILKGHYIYEVGYTPGTGAELDDVFDLQLYEAVNDGETYDLSLGKNSNFETCDQCLLVWEDLNEEAETAHKAYFQQKGKLKISAFDSEKGDITGSLSDVRLIEVTIDASYHSTPVHGGSCIAIPNGEIKYAKP